MRHIYQTDAEIEPLINAYIGDRKHDKQFFPVFLGFLICLNAHCVPDSEAAKTTKDMVIQYRSFILSPAIAPAQKFVQVIDAMIGE